MTRSLLSLLYKAIETNGNGLAIDHDQGCLSWNELGDAVDTLALHLQQFYNVKRGDRVPLLTTHGTRNIVALLAILKTGACYVPMDRDSWADTRVETVLGTVRGKLLINTTDETFTYDAEDSEYTIFHFDDMNKIPFADGPDIEDYEPTENDLACIIFTSGSTGKPKGVMLRHTSIINYGETAPFNMNVQPKDRVLHLLSVAFDASTGMLFSIIAGAGTIVPASKHKLISEAVSCSIWTATPSILASFPAPTKTAAGDSYPRLHTILLGGESIPLTTINTWVKPGRNILNAYGPTEATVASLMHVIKYDEDKLENRNTSIIGKAMPNGPVYILDENLNEVHKCGVEGEIVIAGEGLALGYFEDPVKTAAAYIQWNGETAYRTGDYGRWTLDGDSKSKVVEFRGRRDRVVKNRGFLVNLEGDIQVPMTTLGFGIRGAHVTSIKKRVVAIVYPETVDVTEVRDAMKETMSSFMVPDKIIAVDKLPMTANGKVDDKAVEALFENPEKKVEKPVEDVKGKWPVIQRAVVEALDIAASEVQPESNLLALGASSLDILMITSLCKKKGVRIAIGQMYTLPDLKAVCDEAVQLEEAADDESPVSGPQPAASDSTAVIAPKVSNFTAEQVFAPLTPLQLEMIHGTMQADGKSTNQVRIRYAAQYAAKMEAAWRTVWEHEPIFKTQLRMEDGFGMQVIRQNALSKPSTLVLSHREAYDQANATAQSHFAVGLGAKLNFISFDPNSNSEEGELNIILTVHHALVDGFAMAAILDKVERVAAGQSLRLGPSFPSAIWQLIDRQKDQDEFARSFWKKRLEGVPEVEDLGVPRPLQAPEGDFVAQEHRFSSKITASALRKCAIANRVTIASLFYSAWAMVVAKYTDNDKFTIGAACSGRDTGSIDDTVIGSLMSTLPLVFDLDEKTPINQVLRNTWTQLCDMLDVSWSTPEQVNHRPCSIVSLQYDMPKYDLAVPRIQYSAFENAGFELGLLVDDEQSFRLAYDPARYSETHITDMAVYFLRGLEALCDTTCIDVTSCMDRLVAPEEVKNVSDNLDNAYEKFTKNGETLQQVFAGAVDKFGPQPALESGSEVFTYKELNRLANKVAKKLSDTLPAGQPVAIHADGSAKWIVGILGIVKSGRPYCPLGPQDALSRRTAVCDAAAVSAVMFPQHDQATGNHPAPDKVSLFVEDILAEANSDEEICVKTANSGSDALIVFTSGTTGAPKGVPLSHRSILTLQSSPGGRLLMEPGKRIAQIMSPTFDVCSGEIFSALLHGGTLVLKQSDDPYRHLKTVDIATMTPSLMSALDPADYPNLKVVYSTGEAATPGLVQNWAPGRDLYNAYGPAESTIWSSISKMTVNKPITLGKAIPGVRMYILDRRQQHQVPGATGELFIGGKLLTRGYLNAEDQMKYRFISDPWYEGETMYRTGDICYWNEDGEIVYIGRRDRQVKIRGFRVELPAVEHQIYAADLSVTQNAVICMNDTLVAVVKPSTVDTEKIKQIMSQRMAPAWVPQRWVAVDKFPSSANQKLDTKALLELMSSKDNGSATQSSVPKDTKPLEDPVAQKVAEIWAKVLHLESGTHIQLSDSFIGLGGHSIVQMMLASRLSAQFGVRVSLKDVIQRNTLSDQTAFVKKQQAAANEDDEEEILEQDISQVSSTEEYQFKQYQAATTGTTFNIPLHLRLSGTVDRPALIKSINTALNNHEILRSNYTNTAQGVRRHLYEEPLAVSEKPIRNIQENVNVPFDPTCEPLVRVNLWDDNLLIVASHMISDLNSLQNLASDISALYNGKGGELKSTTVSDYLKLDLWQAKPSKQDLSFWRENLSNIQRLPINIGQSSAFFEGRSEVVKISSRTCRSLADVAKDASLTHHQLALAAVAMTLRKTTNCKEVVLGAPFSGRLGDAELEAQGLLLDRLPIRLRNLDTCRSAASLFSLVQEASQASLSAAIPFADILKACTNSESVIHPIIDVMVTFHLENGNPGEMLDLPGCHVEAVPVHAAGAKFPIMFEWTAYSDSNWSIRIEYDHTTISKKTMSRLKTELNSVLKKLAA